MESEARTMPAPEARSPRAKKTPKPSTIQFPTQAGPDRRLGLAPLRIDRFLGPWAFALPPARPSRSVMGSSGTIFIPEGDPRSWVTLRKCFACQIVLLFLHRARS